MSVEPNILEIEKMRRFKNLSIEPSSASERILLKISLFSVIQTTSTPSVGCWSDGVSYFYVCKVNVTRKAKEQRQLRTRSVYRMQINPSHFEGSSRAFSEFNSPFQVCGVDTVGRSCRDVAVSQFSIFWTTSVLTLCINDKHMAGDVTLWLKSLPKNKPMCQHFPHS